jgi:hypothetical protein
VHDSAILKQFEDQALICEKLGSPFTARVLRLLAARLDSSTRFGDRTLNWSGDPYGDNLALRAAGALHALARRGEAPDLAASYPPHDADDERLWAAIASQLGPQAPFLDKWLDSAPQTNEVARSALLLGAMLTIADRTGLPLELYEIGASAGLNLGFDEYRYVLGEGRAWGRHDAPLTIDCPWRGAAPPLHAALSVVGRHGCDLNPLDPANPADRERLLSYVWADQTIRLDRVSGALKIAAAEHRTIARADAADWLDAQWAEPQPAGLVRVLYHTIVWQYLPEHTKTRIEALLHRLGDAATPDRPLAHVSFEQDGQPNRGGAIMLTIWPGGESVEIGRGDFHGRWAEWN